MSSKKRKLRERKVLILEYLIENNDQDKMRNTLTRLYDKLKNKGSGGSSEGRDKFPRSSIHRHLKNLLERGILVTEEDEISAVNNQPMKVVRYKVADRFMLEAKKLIIDFYNDKNGA